MKSKFFSLIIFLTVLSQLVLSQSVIGIPKANSLIAKKITGSDLIIPLEIGFVNTGTVIQSPTISIIINNTNPNLINQFSVTDLTNIRVINNNYPLSINPSTTLNLTNIFYLFIDRTVSINCDKVINLVVQEGTNILSTIQITVQPEDQLLNLTQYFNPTNKLDDVTKVESSNNVLTINGYKWITSNGQSDYIFFKKNVTLGKNEVLAFSDLSWIFKVRHWQPIPLSIITIPFKIRPEVTTELQTIKSSANSGITNLGFNLDLFKYQIDRYFSNGKKSSHKFSLGFWAAPSVEEMDSVYTDGYLAGDVKTKQLLFSTGITISYSYNDISFAFVPAGWDIGTTSIGQNWVYNGRRWWGFGIAISPKIFATILNK